MDEPHFVRAQLNSDMARLSIRIAFEGAEPFGPGKVRLLELIEKEGSIRAAATAMNMSYRHAWLLLQAVEDTFGAPVIATSTGGAGGGGAKLTDLGKSLVERYRMIETNAASAAAAELNELSRAASKAIPEQRTAKKREPPR
jgi:molybdate transport system regulatory protein